VKDIAEEMLELLPDAGSWTQDEYYLYNTAFQAHCLVGAYGKVMHDDAGYYANRNPRGEYFRRLAGIIAEQYPERVIEEPRPCLSNVVTSFNDHPDTTFEDIRIVLEKAR
jgi:hypothetical protein